MKLTLLTYDSTVAHNAGYPPTNAYAFAQTLLETVEAFSLATGVDKRDIFFMEVNQSDWCARMLIVYANVPQDWKPTNETDIYDKEKDAHFTHLATELYGWIRGGGDYINIKKCPPTRAHELFKSYLQTFKPKNNGRT